MARTNVARPQEPSPPAESKPKTPKKKPTLDYTSEGVVDNDVFLLPFSDYQWAFLITALSTLVRLFRIYEPTSVVFDEVQYVVPLPDPVSAFALAQSIADGLYRFGMES